MTQPLTLVDISKTKSGPYRFKASFILSDGETETSVKFGRRYVDKQQYYEIQHFIDHKDEDVGCIYRIQNIKANVDDPMYRKTLDLFILNGHSTNINTNIKDYIVYFNMITNNPDYKWHDTKRYQSIKNMEAELYEHIDAYLRKDTTKEGQIIHKWANIEKISKALARNAIHMRVSDLIETYEINWLKKEEEEDTNVVYNELRAQYAKHRIPKDESDNEYN